MHLVGVRRRVFSALRLPRSNEKDRQPYPNISITVPPNFSFPLYNSMILIDLVSIPDHIELANNVFERDDNQLLIDELKRDRKKEEAQSARLGRFNTLSKRSMLDKFKHRYRPKSQKYR